MSVAEAKFNRDGQFHKTKIYDDHVAGKQQNFGNLNFSAYRQANDPQFLGIIGKNYYAKPNGNDSSNIQAVINGPAYWKRVCYRPNVAAQFQQEDLAAARRAAEEPERQAQAAGKMSKSSSAPQLQKLPSEVPVPDAYQHIKDTMRPFADRHGKPRIKAPQVGENLHFFNTLEHKYHMKAGGKNLEWGVSRETHRSTPTEMRWILSNYFRTDTQAVLQGRGSEPLFDKQEEKRAASSTR